MPESPGRYRAAELTDPLSPVPPTFGDSERTDADAVPDGIAQDPFGNRGVEAMEPSVTNVEIALADAHGELEKIYDKLDAARSGNVTCS